MPPTKKADPNLAPPPIKTGLEPPLLHSKGTLEVILSCFFQQKRQHEEQFVRFSPLVGHLGWYVATFSSITCIYLVNLSCFALLDCTLFILSSMEGQSKVHCSMFPPLEGQLVGFSPMDGHFITLEDTLVHFL